MANNSFVFISLYDRHEESSEFNAIQPDKSEMKGVSIQKEKDDTGDPKKRLVLGNWWPELFVKKYLAREINIVRTTKFLPLILEGVNDPGIFKAVLMSGGPGSGKTTVASELFGIPNKLSFSIQGLKVFNSDREFEHMLNKAGLSADLTKLNDEELWKVYANENPESIYSKAKIKAAKRYKILLDGRVGLIIDITSRNRSRVNDLKKQLESMGYDTYMIFVNTTKEIALKRNNLRDRKLKKEVVLDMWHQVQDNLDYFKNLFGNNFLEVDGNISKKGDKLTLPKITYSTINKWIKEPVKNDIAKKWINNARKYKVHIGK
jgi:predicted kinase